MDAAMLTPPRSLDGRIAVVTGANGGIGAATARALGAAGAHVVYAVRDPEKARTIAAANPGSAEVRRLDLADLASVRRFAADWHEPIDLLINNAAVWTKTLQRTADGFELQFGTNHLGHFALTNLLLPQLRGRVVALCSQAERMAHLDLDDLDWARRDYTATRAYNDAKLANLLFVAELQRKLTAAGSDVLAMAAHPGFVATGIGSGEVGLIARVLTRFVAQPPEAGALPVLYAATADLPGNSFVGPEHLLHMRGGAQPITRSKRARDPDLAARLWQVSETLTGAAFAL